MNEVTSETTTHLETNVVVIGAGGFVGKNLVQALLFETSYHVRAVVRDVAQFGLSDPRLEIVSGDVLSPWSMHQVLEGADIAYYLVHMLESKAADLYTNESLAAETFGTAARDAGVSRVIYVSGLGRDTETLSKHLLSRHNTGAILRKYVPTVIEFRASIIIGKGSISFEIMRSLIGKLSILILPKWSKTLTQPIGLADVLRYLIAGTTVTGHEIVEIGGPEKISYRDLLKKYADCIGKRCVLIRIPFLPEWLAGFGFYLFVPNEMAQVGRNMVESFKNEMTVTNTHAQELFPNIIPEPVESSFD